MGYTVIGISTSKLETVISKMVSNNPEGTIVSNPPSGKCKVVNIYVDPVTGKTVVEWDNTPVS